MVGKLIITVGVLLVLIGLALTYAPWLINWFGKLPGDIHIKGDKGSVFIPITSMIIISIALTVIVNFFFRR